MSEYTTFESSALLIYIWIIFSLLLLQINLAWTLYCAHLWAKCSLDISNFPEEISSISPSVVFFLFYTLFIEEAFLSLCAVLWTSAFTWTYLSLSHLLFTFLLSLAICKASSDNHFAFLLFFFFGMVLFTTSCTVLQSSIHSYSGTLSPSSNPLNLFVTSTAYS